MRANTAQKIPMAAVPITNRVLRPNLLTRNVAPMQPKIKTAPVPDVEYLELRPVTPTSLNSVSEKNKICKRKTKQTGK